MKKSRIFIISFIILGVVINCVSKNSGEENSSKKDRNMFGHYIPRGLTINSEGLDPGYIMFSIPNSASTYLIDRNGKVVHEWKGNYEVFNQYLMNDGSIVLGANDVDYPVFGFGGPYGRIQKINWDSKMLWDYEYADEKQIVHHDFAVLPNSNILAIAYETWSYEDAVTNGRQSHLIPKFGPWMEKIIEIEPHGPSGGKIVWEWHISDHLIQDDDESKKNFGDPAEHPELIDFNLGDSIPPAISQDSLESLKALGMAERNQTSYNKGSDIFHLNAINYNAELDQIVVSSPELSEVLIIDHSTSIEEASRHSGGNRGKGGDFLYRWGNPENYQQGDSTNRQLFYQHDVRWIEKGKLGEGEFTIYNNNVPMGPDSLEYSAIYQIKTPINDLGTYEQLESNTFGPEQPSWKYIAHDTISFYGGFISGAHRMKNGNTFITEGPKGRLFEVSPEGNILWEYHIPFRGNIRKPNGEPNDLMPMTYSVFRSTFIPADHPALADKELLPLDPQPEPFIMPPAPPNDEKKKDSSH